MKSKETAVGRSPSGLAVSSCSDATGLGDLVGDRVRLGLQRVAGLRHGQRAALRGAALLDDVSQLVRDELVAVGGAGAVLALGEVHVGAGGERAGGHGAVQPVRVVVGVHADIGEVAERVAEPVGDVGVQRRAAAAAV